MTIIGKIATNAQSISPSTLSIQNPAAVSDC